MVGNVNNQGFVHHGNLPRNEGNGEPEAPRDNPRNDRANGNNGNHGNGNHHDGGVHGNQGRPSTGGNNPASVEGGNHGNQGPRADGGNYGNGSMNTGGHAPQALVAVATGLAHQH